MPLPSNWEDLAAVAQHEVERILSELPPDLKPEACALPVTYEPRPNAQWLADGIAPDTMGLFVGPPYSDQGYDPSPIPSQIILFLENIWDCAENSPPVYRREICKTYLHELGHYLGLDEDDLETRGLE